MSLHDKLAQEAITVGDSSPEFTAAAQKHANATWFYVIAAGVVWYFFGWAWALIPIALGVYTAFKSISATMVATRLKSQEQGSETSDTDFVRIRKNIGNISAYARNCSRCK